IARARDDRARADGDPVDGGDDRAPQRRDLADEPAGEARELEQSAGVAREQLGDDVVLVAAGAEAATLAGEDDRAAGVDLLERGEGVGELAVDLEGQRVEPVGSAQGDGGDPAGEGEAEAARPGDHGRASGDPRWATASI